MAVKGRCTAGIITTGTAAITIMTTRTIITTPKRTPGDARLAAGLSSRRKRSIEHASETRRSLP